jgi:hypothetical protein
MKTTSMIALIAVISAASIGVISMNGFTIPLATASVSPESGTIMGHVEYILYDADGNVKSYTQGDNMVVDKGDDCVIGYTFQPGNSGGSDFCTSNANGFRYIGIGNGSAITVDNLDTTLTGTATTIAGASGLMAMRTDSSTVAVQSVDGGTITIATESPFTFTAGVNNTTVRSAGLFDAICPMTAGKCTAYASPQNMFSSQSITVPVSGGDSLSVTWTITVGNTS